MPGIGPAASWRFYAQAASSVAAPAPKNLKEVGGGISTLFYSLKVYPTNLMQFFFHNFL